MGKPILFAKHIHSTFSSWSSNDEWAAIFIADRSELDFKLEPNSSIVSKKFPALNEIYIERIEGDAQFNIVYIPSEKRFYERALNEHKHFFNWHKTEEWAKMLDEYRNAGWIVGDLDQYQELTDFNEREEEKRIEQHFNSGVVLNLQHAEYDGHPELYQGGFSDGVFNGKRLKDYVRDGGCVHGWIGHRLGRKAWHDTLIEEGLRARGISDEGMYSWISSSNGRHFADSLEGYSDDEQRKKIEESLNSMFNCCILFNFPQHAGTLESTNQIRSEVETWGVLIEDTHCDGTGPDKMFQYVRKVHELDFTPQEREQLLSIVSPLVMEVYNNTIEIK
jgi:hypothetical protein